MIINMMTITVQLKISTFFHERVITFLKVGKAYTLRILETNTTVA